jgi:hypothetical protein
MILLQICEKYNEKKKKTRFDAVSRLSSLARARSVGTMSLDEFRTFFFQERAEWVPDAAAAACHECQSVFTLTRRRHHCEQKKKKKKKKRLTDQLSPPPPQQVAPVAKYFATAAHHNASNCRQTMATMGRSVCASSASRRCATCKSKATSWR